MLASGMPGVASIAHQPIRGEGIGVGHPAPLRSWLFRRGRVFASPVSTGYPSQTSTVRRAPSAALRRSQGRVRKLGLRIRAGVHGECEVMGEKLGGFAVHFGARIGALAAADELLVLSIVRELVAG